MQGLGRQDLDREVNGPQPLHKMSSPAKSFRLVDKRRKILRLVGTRLNVSNPTRCYLDQSAQEHPGLTVDKIIDNIDLNVPRPYAHVLIAFVFVC